ncbi:hypothetical protein G6F64_015283 [Rhizopus arrhizus]|uniref:Uncharacterized protein n=1 Tax=Rhizopus oryzae TaxID=64495 RepID=A0A9P6WSK4_RHIOR|nr:hypothetical protein G6F64_015283 [Rhizopus arrhizus]
MLLPSPAVIVLPPAASRSAEPPTARPAACCGVNTRVSAGSDCTSAVAAVPMFIGVPRSIFMPAFPNTMLLPWPAWMTLLPPPPAIGSLPKPP